MMLEHLGETAAAAGVLAAVESVLERRPDVLTPDLGGTATTTALGAAIAGHITSGQQRKEG